MYHNISGFISPKGKVAEVGRLSAKAKMATKVFVRRVFAIFATNASFLHVIANLQIMLSTICNTYHVIVNFLPNNKNCFDPKKHFFAQRFQKSAYIATNFNIATKQRMLGLKIFVRNQTFWQRPFVPSHNFCHPDSYTLIFFGNIVYLYYDNKKFKSL